MNNIPVIATIIIFGFTAAIVFLAHLIDDLRSRVRHLEQKSWRD